MPLLYFLIFFMFLNMVITKPTHSYYFVIAPLLCQSTLAFYIKMTAFFAMKLTIDWTTVHCLWLSCLINFTFALIDPYFP